LIVEAVEEAVAEDEAAFEALGQTDMDLPHEPFYLSRNFGQE